VGLPYQRPRERDRYHFGEEREMGHGPFRNPCRSAAGGPFSFSNSFQFYLKTIAIKTLFDSNQFCNL
jgi:hypothetical protein